LAAAGKRELLSLRDAGEGSRRRRAFALSSARGCHVDPDGGARAVVLPGASWPVGVPGEHDHQQQRQERRPEGRTPGGDRQANHALWRIVFTRMGSCPATRAYVERRTKEGKSKAEIIRCLKRYVARQVYPHLRPDAG